MPSTPRTAGVEPSRLRKRRSAPLLELRVLGGFEARVDGALLSGFESRKTRALLAYLALLDGDAVSREQIAAIFWPDAEADTARRNLRQALHNLRQVVAAAPGALRIDAHEARLDPERMRVDSLQFEAAARSGIDGRGPASVTSLARALELYRGELLAGLNARDAQPFDEWHTAERARLHELAIEAARVALRRTESDGLHETALRFAQRMGELEPASEDACRARMRLLARLGRRARALATFAEFESVLDRDLGVEVSDDVRRLREAIRAEEELPGPDSGVRGPSGPVVPLLGRERERKALAAAWSRVRGGEARLTLLLGEAGSGKSRLVRTFLVQALEGGQGSVLLSRCPARAADPVRAVWRDAVASLPLGLSESTGGTLAAAIGAAVAALPEVAFQRRDLPRAPAAGEADPLAAIAALLRAMARRGPGGRASWPAVLFVDDLEEAPAALDALLELKRRVDGFPVWIVAAARTEGARVDAEIHDREGDRVELERLSAEDVVRAARSLVAERGSAELGETLLAVSAGSPVALAEAINLLADEGVLAADEYGRWQVARPERLATALPSGLGNLLDRRIELVPHTSRRLLGLAAVVGERFDTETLLEVDQEHPAVLDAALQLCVDRWMIRPFLRSWVAHRSDRDLAIWSSGPRQGPLEFSQRLMHDRLYRSIDPKRRAFLEAAVAKARAGRERREGA